MKARTFKKWPAILVIAGCFCCGASLAMAHQEVSVGVSVQATADFDTPLAAYGGWVDVGTYGHCWRPRSVAVDWRPYCTGEWEWTDCGWYWQSEEPWSWACYHYGTWTLAPSVGWVWVPGIEWAPAWVVWRSGGGYIGWAPSAPRGVVVAPAGFAFVETARFHEPIRPTTIVVNNTTVINKTVVLADSRREARNIGGRQQQVVINEGPGVAPVEKATGKPIKPVPVQEADRRTPAPENLRAGNRQGGAKETQPNNVNGANRGERQTQPERSTQPATTNRQDKLNESKAGQTVVPKTPVQPAERGEQPKPAGDRVPDGKRGNPATPPSTPTPPRTPPDSRGVPPARSGEPARGEPARGDRGTPPRGQPERPANPPREGGGGENRGGGGGGNEKEGGRGGGANPSQSA